MSFRLKGFWCVLLFSQVGYPVSINFSGHFRTEGAHYNKLNLGLSSSVGPRNFLMGRALLQPNIVVDDRFSIKSQWSLLTSPTLTPNATHGLGPGQGGWVFGDVNSAGLILSRAWLEWTSDFGVFSLGRVPVSWGYGLLWDAGNEVWDNYQTTLDRIEYRLHLGNVIGALAYSKARKLSVMANENDQEFYTAYLQYNNLEMDVEGGLLYEKQVRSTGQVSDLNNSSVAIPPANPYKLPPNHPDPYPLSKKSPYPFSSNVLDVYLKKGIGHFSFGGEFGWLTGTAIDYNGNQKNDDLNAFGLLFNTTYEYHKFRAFMEFLYASGDGNLNADHLNGFVLLHRNRSPGIILGRELLGPYASNHLGYGSLVVYGDADTFSGVMYFRPGIRFDWSSSWSSGIETVIAYKANPAANEAKALGVEFDAGTEYSPYKNFDLGVNLGYLFPGKGLRVDDPQGVFAFRSTAALRF